MDSTVISIDFASIIGTYLFFTQESQQFKNMPLHQVIAQIKASEKILNQFEKDQSKLKISLVRKYIETEMGHKFIKLRYLNGGDELADEDPIRWGEPIFAQIIAKESLQSFLDNPNKAFKGGLDTKYQKYFSFEPFKCNDEGCNVNFTIHINEDTDNKVFKEYNNETFVNSLNKYIEEVKNQDQTLEVNLLNNIYDSESKTPNRRITLMFNTLSSVATEVSGGREAGTAAAAFNPDNMLLCYIFGYDTIKKTQSVMLCFPRPSGSDTQDTTKMMVFVRSFLAEFIHNRSSPDALT